MHIDVKQADSEHIRQDIEELASPVPFR
jgi:hypothetical protein